MREKRLDYKVLDHTADLGMIVCAETLEGLFESAALSMIHIMLKVEQTGPSSITPLSIEGQDLADLMVRWLGEVLYLFEGERVITVDANVQSLSGHHLEASVSTIPFDPQVHEVLYEIKAVTYHQIEVLKKNSHWKTRVVFDL